MRKRKLLSLLVLLMTAATGAWADADVTWNSSNVSDLSVYGDPYGYGSYTKEGITLRGNAENVDANWANYGYGDGINFNMNASGGYTFTAPDGKKFTKIEMTIYSYDGWYEAAYDDKLGSGWPSGEDAAMTVYLTNKVTWTGDATSTVDLLTDAGLGSFGGTTASSIDFYFEAPSGPTVIASGDCGTDVTYSLTDDGTLTISGSGAMADYADDGSDAPWYSQRWNITSVVIEDGVTTIGASAFCDCDNLTSVSTSNSVTSIGYKAFYECEDLASVSISSGVTSIGANAFYGCGTSAAAMTVTISGSSLTTVGISAFQNSNIESITLPASVTSIGQNAFAYCSNLATVTLDSNPFIDEGAFYGIKDGATVTMNLTAKSAGGAYWTTFFNREYGFQADANTQVFKAELSGTSITLHEVTDKIVTNSTAVILKSTGNPVMTLTTASSSNTDANSLQGVARPEGWGADGMYVLNNGSKGVGFYKLASGKTLGVGKAFLSYGSPDAPAFFLFSDDNVATGIASMHNAQCIMHNDVFDLQGRRVVNPTKGLYIVNGKKVFINK